MRFLHPGNRSQQLSASTETQELHGFLQEVEESDSDDGWSPKVTKHDRNGLARVQTVEELANEPADVFFNVDMYDSVMVAAFGGVTMNLDGSDELHVHPGILFLFCIPLVILQFWLTFCTTFGMQPFWKTLDLDAEESMVISMKLLLIVVVQLSFFDNMLMTLRCFVFAINPTSWTDVKRIDPDDLRTGRSRLNVLHWSLFLAPFAVLALLAKVLIQYWVSVQSMSIILASDNVKEAVFDALAISFIVELDVAMWNLVRTIMHLDCFEHFTFQLWPPARRQQAVQESYLAWIMDFSVLHRGKGARRLENFIVFGVLFIVYFRITLMAFQATDTGILPAYRDVCAMWSWYRGEFENWQDRVWGTIILDLIQGFASMSKFPWNIEREIAKMADPALDGHCSGPAFKSLSWSKAIELCKEHQRDMVLFLVAFSLLLLLPQLVYSTGALQKVIKNLDYIDYPDSDMEEEGQQAEGALEQSMLNARKIQHLARVAAKRFASSNKRLDRLEQMLSLSKAANGPANHSQVNGQSVHAMPMQGPHGHSHGHSLRAVHGPASPQKDPLLRASSTPSGSPGMRLSPPVPAAFAYTLRPSR